MYRAPQVFRYTGRQSFGEVYTLCFKGGSTNGGAQARWRRDGKELFYIALDGRLMAVPIRIASTPQTIEAGSPGPLGNRVTLISQT